MGKKYKQITFEERREIHLLLAAGVSLVGIAVQLGVNKSTISREIKRNRDTVLGYSYDIANSMAKRRRRTIGSKIMRSRRLQSHIKNRLVMGWSPEVIAGRLKLENSSITISHESIYKWIFDESDDKKLKQLLRHKKAKRGLRRVRKVKCMIEDRVSIHQRPAEFANQFGHFEGDTIVFKKHVGGVVVLCEKQSRKAFVAKVDSLKSDLVMEKVSELLRSLTPDARNSITFDNGSEFFHHHKVHGLLKNGVYFCDPYASWQKGAVENLNFVIRKFVRKGSLANDFSPQQIKDFAYIINNTPRKSLGYLTPNEKFKSLLLDKPPILLYISLNVALRL